MFFENDNPLNKYDNVYIDLNGYLRNSTTRKLVHREIMEIELDRKLKWWETVEHLDGNKMNNDSSNLWVCRKTKTAKTRFSMSSLNRKEILA